MGWKIATKRDHDSLSNVIGKDEYVRQFLSTNISMDYLFSLLVLSTTTQSSLEVYLIGVLIFTKDFSYFLQKL